MTQISKIKRKFKQAVKSAEKTKHYEEEFIELLTEEFGEEVISYLGVEDLIIDAIHMSHEPNAINEIIDIIKSNKGIHI